MNRFRAFYYQNLKTLFLKRALSSQHSPVPFFILSSGRSGSTLLRKLLLSHAPVNIPPESDDLLPKLIKFYLRHNHKSWQYIVTNCIQLYNSEKATVHWENELTDSDLQKLLSCDIKDQNLATIVHFMYSEYAKQHHFPSEIWGDKTPFLIFRLSWLYLLFPSAKYIFLIRDGRAVVNSFLKMDKGYTLTTACNRWLKALKVIRLQQQKIPAQQYLCLKYEDLVLSPDKEMQKIYTFLGISPRIQPLPKPFLGDDVLPHHDNIKSAVSASFIEKWKTELTTDEIHFITKKLGPELKTLGYS